MLAFGYTTAADDSRRQEGYSEPSTKVVDKQTAQTLDEQSKRPLDRTLTHEAINFEALCDADTVSPTLHGDYLKLKNQLNAISASCPPYADACKLVGLDPQRPILPFLPGTKIPPRLGKLERELKPWQVQFLAWAGRICPELLA